MTFSRRVSFVAATMVIPAMALVACSNPDAREEATPVTTTVTSTVAPSTTSSTPSSTSSAPSSTPPVSLPEDQRARAASLLMPGVTSFEDALYKLNAGVGGIFITGWADSGLLTEPGRDIAALREIVGRPFDVAIDYEGGRVQRFTEVFGVTPAPRQLAAGGDAGFVQSEGYRVGQALRAKGVTVNFAPVIDVDGGNLDVVGDRSFSDNPAAAGEFGAAFARGLNDAGVTPVFKHYPGHGRASGDTHLGEAITPPLGELFGHDLVPFDVALPAAPGAAVMVGHMVVPGLGDGTTPSSLNNHAYGLLRGHNRFDGLVYTDDLTGMKAITDFHSPQEAAWLAIAAGADQALWSSAVDINSVIDAVDSAVSDGRINRVRFNNAAERIARQLDKQLPEPAREPAPN